LYSLFLDAALGMILMQKEDLCRRILNRQTADTQAPKNSAPVNVGHMDDFLGELAGTNTLVVENRTSRQVVGLGAAAPNKDDLLKEIEGKEALARAGQAVRAVAILNELGQSLDVYAGEEDYGSIEIAIS